MGDPYLTATHPALNSVCCYTLGGNPPCPKKGQKLTHFPAHEEKHAGQETQLHYTHQRQHRPSKAG